MYLNKIFFQCSSVSKESACNSGDLGLIPGSGRSPGEGNDNPLQYSCLENPIDRVWQATVHGAARVGHDLEMKPPPQNPLNYLVCPVLSRSVISDSLKPHELQSCQASLPLEFSRQEYWSGMPFSTPVDIPDPGIESPSLVSPALAGRYFTTSGTWCELFYKSPSLPPDASLSPGRANHHLSLKSLGGGALYVPELFCVLWETAMSQTEKHSLLLWSSHTKWVSRVITNKSVNYLVC